MLFEFGDAAWSAGSDGLFIPLSDLPGVIDEELADEIDVEIKTGQAIHSICKQVVKSLTGTSFLTTATDPNKLGVSYTLTESLPSVGLKNKTYSLTFTKVLDLAAKTIYFVPVATAGTNNGKGDFSLTDLFANCAKVASGSNTAGAGILIKSSVINSYGASTHANLSLSADAREWLESFMLSLFDSTDGLIIRATGVESPFPSAPVKGAPSSVTLPTVATQSTNPTTGLVGANLSKLNFVSYTLAVTIQLIENEDETVSVNVV